MNSIFDLCNKAWPTAEEAATALSEAFKLIGPPDERDVQRIILNPSLTRSQKKRLIRMIETK